MPLATTVGTPFILIDPGILWAAPLGTAAPTNTVAGSVFTDAPAAAYVAIGATSEGSEFTYNTETDTVTVAELFDPVKIATVSRNGSMAFAMAHWTLQNVKLAFNAGVGAITPTSGTGATALATLDPPAPGSEVRVVLLWESRDATVRIYMRQCFQGGEMASAFRKAPDAALIPVEFSFEKPTGAEMFSIYTAGASRLGP